MTHPDQIFKIKFGTGQASWVETMIRLGKNHPKDSLVSRPVLTWMIAFQVYGRNSRETRSLELTTGELASAGSGSQ